MDWIELKMPADDTTSDFRVETWMHALLHCGQDSYSHLLNTIVRYKNVMGSMKKSDGEAVIITSVVEVWASAPQIMHTIFDKFLGFRLISPVALARWVFSADTSAQLARLVEYHQWEVLHLAIDSCLTRCEEQASAPKFMLAKAGDSGESEAHDTDAKLSEVETEKFELFVAIFQVHIYYHPTRCATCSLIP
jgi:nuclear cap-binding protein subunit 1